ncbi:MAG: hypothetical protein WCZ65_04180 [Lysobacteraceae bacterium]
MPWVLFGLALVAIIVAFNTYSIGLAAICLLAALGLGVAGVVNLLSARISGASQNPASMLDASAIASIRANAGKPSTVVAAESRPASRDTDGDNASAGDGDGGD